MIPRQYQQNAASENWHRFQPFLSVIALATTEAFSLLNCGPDVTDFPSVRAADYGWVTEEKHSRLLPLFHEPVEERVGERRFADLSTALFEPAVLRVSLARFFI